MSTLTRADRARIALGVVYEAKRALETLSELRKRLLATGLAVDGEMLPVERSLALALSVLSQLMATVEALKAAAVRAANTERR